MHTQIGSRSHDRLPIEIDLFSLRGENISEGGIILSLIKVPAKIPDEPFFVKQYFKHPEQDDLGFTSRQ